MTTLLGELRTLIATEGPISVERFMALALGHPRYGYYMTRDPLGTAGDFTTAPEISQMFGELIGLWAAEVWHAMGRPEPVRFVELGPGRGTLMADALRAARALPPFRAALDVHLVETSPVLRQAQERSLAVHPVGVTWHGTVDTLPDGPAIILANEFFDALPVRQFVRTSRGFCERLVGLDVDGALVFGLAAEPVSLGDPGVPDSRTHRSADAEPQPLSTRERGASGRRANAVGLPGQEQALPNAPVLEVGFAAQSILRGLAQRMVRQGGALLVIDYGHTRSGFAETLQAVKRHRFVDPLAEPGEADLTAHVDFAALARVAKVEGARVHGPVSQGHFLGTLGLAARAEALSRTAAPEQAAAIEAAVTRLAGPDPGMGDLFKVLAVTHAALPPPPGFSSEI
ncbi:class I SAM-dependent methyltransferase [Lichenifustis flavocetrariae]|uniref:SAM-dependent methyltransferase n=1 Tax=Lichenifustis flavocetrariae TaxID=2949735 RepID=A0AA41Z069_9HYPH|nr:SAM-dependent methyltransferase [Lichenifustis flavocetrariae]MCW6508123.1 SAM-dependent methyltransferase [Lichenifustis flavocetrariae]